MTFQLDPRLHNDCFKLAESAGSLWLLLNNSHFPWMIIVPKTQHQELYQLSGQEQTQLQAEINLISEFVNNNFECAKLNVACIGNIVKQMHVHIIARSESDPCWPGVVWGTDFKQSYNIADVFKIQAKLKQFCEDKNINDLQFASPQ
ncbi:HIT family protein [Psychromonas aquimarina]|uniref:HIT family protein n=1 Tax=Psychromonas aquimarina TaxID=444919 RepID=UPI000422A54C|nr:HIT family protein [Psychromonas aquimarina]